MKKSFRKDRLHRTYQDGGLLQTRGKGKWLNQVTLLGPVLNIRTYSTYVIPKLKTTNLLNVVIKTNKYIQFYKDINLVTSPTCFGHSCGHPQGAAL
jgi:hypothetical protein